MGKLYPVEQVAAVLVALAQAGIPPDVQELLVHGNPDRGIAPGALAKALALHPVKQSDGLAERVREAEIADRAYERLEGHFRSLAHIARHTLECNADDVRKLEDSAEFVARYRKEQRHVHG